METQLISKSHSSWMEAGPRTVCGRRAFAQVRAGIESPTRREAYGNDDRAVGAGQSRRQGRTRRPGGAFGPPAEAVGARPAAAECPEPAGDAGSGAERGDAGHPPPENLRGAT